MERATPNEFGSAKNIVILGASYAGISTAHYLLKHVLPSLPPNSHKVVLVNPSLETMCRPACPRALISDSMFSQNKLFVNISALFEEYSRSQFSFIHGKAVELDHKNGLVTLEVVGNIQPQQLSFHALVIATGASTVSPLLGYTKDSVLLREKWAEFREALPRAKSIVIAGGGPAGIETAGELGEYLNGWGMSRRRRDASVSITVVTSSSKILPVLRQSIAKKGEALLNDLGVKVLKHTKVVEVSPSEAGVESVASGATITLHDGTILEADLYIPAVGMTYNTSFIDKTLLDVNGRVITNSATLRVDGVDGHIYALGDVSSAARPAVHNVLAQVPVLCANMKMDLQGIASHEGDKVFKEDKRETQLVAIGKSKGIGAAMGWRLPSILIWLIKGRDYWLWTTDRLWSGRQWQKEG